MDEVMTPTEVMDDLSDRYLTFYIGDSVYGIELLHVIEIISIQSITPVPYVPSYIKGLINLRGKISPVIDVRLKFGLSEKEYDDKTCIIVVVIQDMNVCLIVDSISEVATVSADQLATPPEFSDGDTNKYLKSVANLGSQSMSSRLILNIDCDKFFQNDLDNRY